MRVRNIAGVDQLLPEFDCFIERPVENKGRWKAVFGNSNPLHIELGMGKGQFITSLAKEHPNINFIGIEKSEELVYKALQRLGDMRLSNLYMICENAENLKEIFGEGELERIYLNFSDPWVKARHAKRRLPHRKFLAMYSHILKASGELRFRTDSLMLFEFALEEIKATAMQLREVSYDIHSKPLEGHIMTEYEEKFTRMGKPIYQCIAVADKG